MGARDGTLNRTWQKKEVSPEVNSDTLYLFMFTQYENDPTEEPPEILIDRLREQLNLINDVHTQQPNGSKTLNTKIIEVTGKEDPLRKNRVDKYEQNYIDIFYRNVGGKGNVLIQADEKSWHHGYVILTPSTGEGSIVSEIEACMHGLKDGNEPVGFFFADIPNYKKITEFGTYWMTFKLESEGGVYFLPPPP
ncbi:MAG: hypothetical protein ACTSWD_14145 [Candidatus Heimdallarchaeota archaeon]